MWETIIKNKYKLKISCHFIILYRIIFLILKRIKIKNISLINCGTINLLNDMQLSFSGVYKNDSFQSV